jgi:hypothetical protein
VKNTKKIEALIKELNHQIQIKEAAEARADEIKAEVLQFLQEVGETKVEAEHGVATLVVLKKFDFSEFPQVAEAKKLAKMTEEEAKELAPFTSNATLRFSPNRGLQVKPAKAKVIWKSSVVLGKVKA